MLKIKLKPNKIQNYDSLPGVLWLRTLKSFTAQTSEKKIENRFYDNCVLFV